MFVARSALASPNSMSSQSGWTSGEARFPVSARGAASLGKVPHCLVTVHGRVAFGNSPDVRA